MKVEYIKEGRKFRPYKIVIESSMDAYYVDNFIGNGLVSGNAIIREFPGRLCSVTIWRSK